VNHQYLRPIDAIAEDGASRRRDISQVPSLSLEGGPLGEKSIRARRLDSGEIDTQGAAGKTGSPNDAAPSLDALAVSMLAAPAKILIAPTS
jgi:hypothetical protein